MQSLSSKLLAIQQQIEQCAAASGRPAAEIGLLAVSKTQPANQLQAAYDAGQRAFGENYLQEALAKMNTLSNLDIEWHFIGPIQSNKTRDISENFDWVHTVDRLKIADRLNKQRPEGMAPLKVCLQVNIDEEESKSGCSPDQVKELALAVAELPNIQLRGLMAIPKPIASDTATSNPGCPNAFVRMKNLLEELKRHPQLSKLDTLSMGMSGDMPLAIEAGATIVRIGTAIFGPRN